MVAGVGRSIEISGRDRFYSLLLNLDEEPVYSEPVTRNMSENDQVSGRLVCEPCKIRLCNVNVRQGANAVLEICLGYLVASVSVGSMADRDFSSFGL